MNEDFYNSYLPYIKALNGEAENLIWETVYLIDSAPGEKRDDEIRNIYNLINSFNYVSETINSRTLRKKANYSSIKDFFCFAYPEGKAIFKNFKKRVKPVKAEKFNDSGLKEYFEFCAGKIPDNIKNVLSDNPEDRHWSAVWANGLIKSYLILMNQFTCDKKPVDIKSYFAQNGFSDADYYDCGRRACIMELIIK